MEEYPEDNEITIPPPFGVGNGGFPEHMIKSTPTTPVGVGSHNNDNNGNHHHSSIHGNNRYNNPSSNQQQQASRYQSHLQNALVFNQISEAHSDHEYEQMQHQGPPPPHQGNNNSPYKPPPPLAPSAHSHHGSQSHSFLGPRNTSNSSMHAPSGSGPVYSQTPDVNTAFSFGSNPYHHAALGNAYPGSSHLAPGGGNHQPVTQPTTPVFAPHHSSPYSHHGPSSNHHHHPLYHHNSHHHPVNSKYTDNHNGVNNNNNSHNNGLAPYQPKPQQQQQSSHSNHNNGPSHTPNNTIFGNIETEISSPLFCEDIVNEVFNDLQLSSQ